MFNQAPLESAPCFSVALCDCPSLPELERQRAEARFTRTLIRQFGDEHQVAAALRVMEHLEQACAEEITEDHKLVHHRWMKAVRAASESGLQGIGTEEGCYFEVRTL